MKIIVPPNNLPGWVAICASVLDHCLSSESPRNLLVVDYASSIPFAPMVWRPWLRKVLFPRLDLPLTMRQVAEANSVPYVELDQLDSEDMGNFPFTEGQREVIDEALVSALGTISRDDMRHQTSKLARKVAKARARVERIYSRILYLCSRLEIEEIFLCNGRMPEQTAVILAAEKLNIKVVFFERGTDEKHYYLSDLSVHDRTAHQKRCLGLAESLTLSHRATDWFQSRISLESQGSGFAGRWTGGDFSPRGNFWLFASSSTDEFANLGPDWHTQDWEDQWDFVHSILKFKDPSTWLTIRLHPNLANKYLPNVMREIRRLREATKGAPGVEVISPFSSANSYILASKADCVFVWNSTLGLEASWLGARVFTGAPSYYDEVADVNPAHSPTELERSLSGGTGQNASTMKRKAEISMFHQLNSDQAITQDPKKWLPIDFQSSFRLRLEFILSSATLSDFFSQVGRSVNMRLVRVYLRLALR